MPDLKISNLDLTNSEDYQLVHFGNESNILYAVYAKVEVDCNNSSVVKQIDFLIRSYNPNINGANSNDDVVFHNPSEIRIDQSHQSDPKYNMVKIIIRERLYGDCSNAHRYQLSSSYQTDKIDGFIFTTRPDLSGRNTGRAIGDNCYESIIKVLK